MTLIKFMTMISVVSIIATSCNNSDKNSSLIFDELSESLKRSNLSIQSSTNNALQELKQKSEDPPTKEKAEKWLQKATDIVDASNSLKGFIDSLQKAIEANVGSNSYPAKAEAAAKEILLDQKCGARIFDGLKAYRFSVLKIDDRIDKEFAQKPSYSDSVFFTGSKNADEFSLKLFENTSSSKALCLLQKVKNSILLTENELVNYCRFSITSNVFIFNKLELITLTDRTHYKKGDELVIKSGMGAFNITSHPIFFINGREALINENGVAVYKTIVNGKPGKRIVPVQVYYTNVDGSKETAKLSLEYQVDE